MRYAERYAERCAERYAERYAEFFFSLKIGSVVVQDK